MPRYLDTTGKSSLAIGVCGRCGIKMPIGELMPDPNTPGVRVCRDDLDQLDPWRMAPRPSDRITVQFARPDIDIAETQPATVWMPGTNYQVGALVVPTNPWTDTTNVPVNQFAARIGGLSGSSAPLWPGKIGQTVVDNGVTWINQGIYLG